VPVPPPPPPPLLLLLLLAVVLVVVLVDRVIDIRKRRRVDAVRIVCGAGSM